MLDFASSYGWLRGLGVMLPYVAVAVLGFALYLRRSRALLARQHLAPRRLQKRRFFRVEALAVLAFVLLCALHRWFLGATGTADGGTVGVVVVVVLVAASLCSLAVLAWSFRMIEHALSGLMAAPRELQESQDLLAGVLNSSPDGVMAFDSVRDESGAITDFRIRLVNPSAAEIIGRDAEAMIGKLLLEELPGNRETGLFDKYREVVETGVPSRNEFRYEHDGIDASFTNTAVRRGDGFAVTFRDVTAHQQMIEALNESQERFRVAFEDASIGKALVNVDGFCIRVNASFCEFLGYGREELLGKTFMEITHPDDLEEDLRHIRQMLDGEIETYSIEKRYLHRSGYIVWGSLSVSRFVRDGGPVEYFIAEVQDITERKRTEAMVEENAKRLQLLLQVTSSRTESLDDQIHAALALTTRRLGLDVGILSRVADRAYVIDNVHAPGTDLAPGRTFELGRTYCQLTLESDDVVAIDRMGDSEFAGHPCYQDFGLESYIGIPVYVDDVLYGTLNFSSSAPRMRPFDDLERDFVRLLGLWAAHAIERKTASDALRESEARFRNAFKGAAIGKAIVSPDGRFRRVNPALCNLLGYTEAALLQKTVEDVTLAEDLGADREAFERLLAGDEMAYELEKRYLHRDGHPVWVLKSAARVANRAGVVQHVVVETIDITERKEADRLKNEFVSMVSHELRTPLTSISGALRLVTSQIAGEVAAPVRQMLGIAHRNADRLVRLINDILDVQKIEAGKLRLDVQPALLGSLMQTAVESNDAYGERRDVSLRLQPAPPDAQVVVDADRFMQIMANLISNAVKFSPDGAEVDVVADWRGAGVRVSVTDHGPGISEAFRVQLFDRFAQADSSTTRKQEGTGLGLNITKSLVELHGGTLGFETEVGRGSTFFVDLPATRVLPPERHAAAAEAAILIVEDDPDVARLLREVLAQDGFGVDIAYTLEQATLLTAERDYAAATVDLHLPDGDGIALLREWDARVPRLPAVVVSVEANDRRQRLRAAALPVADWLDKPFESDELLAAVRRVAGPPPPRRMLHVEDDADCAAMTALVLAPVGEVVRAATLAEAHAALATNAFDLAILDLNLPDGDGLDLLPVLRKFGTPVAIYSARVADAGVAERVVARLAKEDTAPGELVHAVRSAMIPQTPTPDAPTPDAPPDASSDPTVSA